MRRVGLALLVLYGAALTASHATRAVRANAREAGAVRALPSPQPDAPVLVLVGCDPDVGELAARLATQFRVRVAPASAASFGMQAAQLRTFLDAAQIDRAHFVGLRAGGGVALEMAASTPDRVSSLVLLGSIGAPEFEGLGSDALNQLLRGIQLAGIEAARALLPHFGALDRSGLGAETRARFASDQARLRPILASWAGPALIVHATDDAAVPIAAARESQRLLPQSEFLEVDAGPESLAAQRDAVTRAIADFAARADAGRAATRANADPARAARAALPFDAASADAKSINDQLKGAAANDVMFAYLGALQKETGVTINETLWRQISGTQTQ